MHFDNKKGWRHLYFYIFLFIGHHFTFSTSIWIWWNALLSFPHRCTAVKPITLLYSSLPSLPNTQYIHSSCSWTTRKHEHFFFLIQHSDKTIHSHNKHTFTQLLWQRGCWVELKGMQEVQYGSRGGAVQRFPPRFRYNRHFSQTNLTIRLYQSLGPLVTTMNLWIRHECSATYQNWLQ